MIRWIGAFQWRSRRLFAARKRFWKAIVAGGADFPALPVVSLVSA